MKIFKEKSLLHYFPVSGIMAFLIFCKKDEKTEGSSANSTIENDPKGSVEAYFDGTFDVKEVLSEIAISLCTGVLLLTFFILNLIVQLTNS